MDALEKGNPRYTKTIIALFFGSFVTFALLYCIQPLIPILTERFSVTAATASLSLSFTTGMLALSMIVVSTLSDHYGRRKIMVISLLLSSLLALLSAFSPNYTFLLVVRALLGLALAGFPSIAMTYISEEFHSKSLGAVMGMYVSGTTIGGLSSRLIVNLLVDFFSWRVAILVIALISIAISIWFWKHMPESRNFTRKEIHIRSLLANTYGALKEPGLIYIYGLGFLLMGCFVSLYNYISFPLMAAPYHLSESIVGLVFLVYLTGTFSSTYLGQMSDRFGKIKILSISIFLMLIGAVLTLHGLLLIKLVGMALFTFGFFGGHSIASGMIGQKSTRYKAQASSIYLLFYYGGSSVVGTGGGVFLHHFGWVGVIMMIISLLLVSYVLVLMSNIMLTRTALQLNSKDPFQHEIIHKV